MNLSNPEELKNFLRSSGLRPKDYMGQNFLVDEDILQKIIRTADLKPSDTVLEIGPGLGVLTGELAPKVKKLIAVEKDPKLFSILKINFKNHAQVELFNEDILKFHLAKHIPGDYKVVANIPYYLTSKLLRNLLSAEGGSASGGENSPKLKLMVLMVQKEVGERVIASPGELSILGISVQIYSDPEIAAQVSKQSFWPVPKVDSVILKITPKNKYPEITDRKLFFRILKMAFAGKRKQIHNTIKNPEALQKAGIDPKTRPQDVEIGQWIRLYQATKVAKI